jgi:putative membrane protein
MASGVIPGFDVHGFWSAVFAALIISGVNWVLSSFINVHGRIARVDKGKMEEEDYIELEKQDDDTWE